MSKGLNRTMLIGRVGQDITLRTVGQQGAKVAEFSLATDEGKTKSGERITEWHKIVVWGKVAEVVDQYVKKGQLIYVEGRNQTVERAGRDGGNPYKEKVINLEGFRFCDDKDRGEPRRDDDRGGDNRGNQGGGDNRGSQGGYQGNQGGGYRNDDRGNQGGGGYRGNDDRGGYRDDSRGNSAPRSQEPPRPSAPSAPPVPPEDDFPF